MPSERQLFLQYLAQTSEFPLMLEIDRAEGVYLFDKTGKAYIDLISGIGVSNVGHRHPQVIKAIEDQVQKYLHVMVYGEFVQSPQVRLAHAIAETLPDPLSSVYLLNSGSEAVEGAIKLAKRYTDKTKIVSCQNAYHGSSHGALSASGDEKFKRNFRPLLPGFSHIPFGDEHYFDEINEDTAAVLIETIQGEAGVRVAPKGYFQTLRKRCNDTDTLLILDEIQCGFGRTGTFWAFEQEGIVPDIVVSAKGMGGGMPIGCFVSSPEIMGVFRNNPILGHISTFGGHPVSAAAALATTHIIQEEGLLQQVESKSSLFKELLIHPKIKSIRNRGLMMAVKFETFEELKPIIDQVLQLGVITDWFLFDDRSMRIAPPLTITEKEVKKACSLILQALQ
ncbi:MAG: aspartate aminotransferase family protein [Cyclobacteriaceae bacterium]|nr:aspartate aminotransferase family protein [Cyclobacteriaceae bacterium HetDA_MAG_MS6]